MRILTRILVLLIESVIFGVRRIVELGPIIARRYLRVLIWTAAIGVGTTLVAGIIGLGMGSQWFLAATGLWCLLSSAALALVGTPIGALIGAALPMNEVARPAVADEEEESWLAGFSPVKILRELRGYQFTVSRRIRKGVERYFRIVRQALTWEGFGFFFLALLPIQGNGGLALILLLGVVSIGLSLAYTSGWVRLARGATMAGLLYVLFAIVFPKINLLGFLFPTPSANALTNEAVEKGAANWWGWFNAHYAEPGMFLIYALVVVVGIMLWRSVRRLTAATAIGEGAREHGHSATPSAARGESSGRTGLVLSVLGILAVVLLCGWLLLQIQGVIWAQGASHRMDLATEAVRVVMREKAGTPVPVTQEFTITAPARAGTDLVWSSPVVRSNDLTTLEFSVPAGMGKLVLCLEDGLEDGKTNSFSSKSFPRSIQFASLTNFPITVSGVRKISF